MNEIRTHRWFIVFFILIWFPGSLVTADGGYFSSESVAVSADQRAIIIQNGNEISMTFSSSYTGEGKDFGLIIPTPVPPDIRDISEAGENGEAAFRLLDEQSAPLFYASGCFPSGTEVLTESGPQAIETVDPGTEVYSCNLATGKWILKRVLKQLTRQYAGDMITIGVGQITIQATGNHPFYVLDGERLPSRPLPRDIPKGEQRMTGQGRWVEARDLKEGDVLKAKCGDGLVVTSLSSRQEKTSVYNLNVEGYHNYSVHQRGILVHNKGSLEAAPESLVEVYRKVTLEHHEVSILGPAEASTLLDWLQKNNYQVNHVAREVLDTYIKKNWAFVVIKLIPVESRHYEKEFLPPLTIRYQSDQLIYPLHISSISTTRTARITLYVISESTVASSNFPTTVLGFDDSLAKGLDPESYIDVCIQRTLEGSKGNGLVVMWSGEFAQSAYRKEIIDGLMKTPFPEDKKSYLTCLETMMSPSSMTKDIRLLPDSQPKDFRAMITAEDGYDSTADLKGHDLIAAAQVGDKVKVKRFLQAGIDVDTRGENGWTALMRAAGSGHTEIVQILLEAGAGVNVRDGNGWTALMKAAGRGHNETVRILLEAGADVNRSDKSGLTALMVAVKGDHIEVVRILLKAGADVNSRGYSMTALMIAAEDGSTEVVQILLQAGADLNLTGYYGTALMSAVGRGHTEVMQILLEAGADVNVGNKSGNTTLMYAMWQDNTEVVQILLQAGADVNVIGDFGGTALMGAAERGYVEVVKILLEAGADVNLRDGTYRRTALMKAAGAYNVKYIDGEYVRYIDGDPVQVSPARHTEVVKILLEAGADVNIGDMFNDTALMLAAGSGCIETVKILLEAVADVTTKNWKGKTALMIAKDSGHTRIVNLLKEDQEENHEQK